MCTTQSGDFFHISESPTKAFPAITVFMPPPHGVVGSGKRWLSDLIG